MAPKSVTFQKEKNASAQVNKLSCGAHSYNKFKYK